MQLTSTSFIKSMQNLPMWVKQVLAAELSEDLNSKLADFTSLMDGENLFQYLCPKTTVKGKSELTEKKMSFSDAYYVFLKDCIDAQCSIFEVTLKNNWALSDAAKIFIKLYELEFIIVPGEKTEVNIALGAFIANKIKTGEFLKKIGKIDAVQLEQALRYQKQLNEEGRHMKMVSILIKMGFITDKGLDSLIQLKEESKRRMPSNIGINTAELNNPDEVNDNILRMQKEISRLENENLIMKKHLKKLLHMN